MHWTTAKTHRARREVLKGQIAPGQPQFLELVLLRSQATKKLFMIIVGLRHLWHAFVVVFKPLIFGDFNSWGYNQSSFA